MPYWSDLFSLFGHVEAYSASHLNDIACGNDEVSGDLSPKLKDYLPQVDCLLVRSTTKVNRALLNRMPSLSFVATATAGFDHFDIAALEKAGIQYYVAGGCNAQAVAQYVVCALLQLADEDRFVIKNKVVGIVGNGNVGTKVAVAMQALGAKVIVYDPPQHAKMQEIEAHNTGPSSESLTAPMPSKITPQYASFTDILRADIICIHAPLDSDVQYPTKHLFNDNTLLNLHEGQYLINAGRGEIIDNTALQAYFHSKALSGKRGVNVVLDVWENEPEIMTPLLPYLRLASPHIAGHTLEGKANGTFMLYQQLCIRLHYPQNLSLKALLPRSNMSLSPSFINDLQHSNNLEPLVLQNLLKQICHFVYDIQNDDRVFRRHMAQFKSFAKLRKEYPIRREFSALSLELSPCELSELLRAIGFTVSNDR